VSRALAAIPARKPTLYVGWPSEARTLTQCVVERLLVVAGECQDRPAGEYANALEAALADPFERAGLTPAALQAIEYVEGVADAEGCTVLELIEALEITIKRVRFA
jgi:hypothetical protein